MSHKVVGIVCSTVVATEKNSPRQVLNRPYVWAVEQAGAIPVLLPVTTQPEVIDRYLGMIDGLLVSGGVDVAPSCYGQEAHPQLGEVDDDRDTLELPLIRAALAQDMPIFAICRGIQSLNVALGGTLYQDLPSEFPSCIFHQQSHKNIPRDQFSHTIEILPETRLHSIVGSTWMATNSFHHQALQQVAEGLEITAYASDGVIEAAEMPAKRYVVGVQFHPEETAPHDEKSRKLFEAFVQAT